MKKTAFGLLLLFFLGAIAFIWLIKAPLLSSYLSDKMRVPVSIGRISIFPHHASIHDFTIKNPKGFKMRRAFEVDKVDVEYQWRQLFRDPLVIDQITMDQIFLRVEFSNALGTKNNWTAIAQGMPKQTSKRQVILHKLLLLNINVEIVGLGLTGKTITRQIDRIEIDDIDSRNGFPTELLIQKIFGGAGIQQFIKDAFDPQQMMQKALSPFKLFGENERAVRRNFSSLAEGPASYLFGCGKELDVLYWSGEPPPF